jgi:hypothetical protein
MTAGRHPGVTSVLTHFDYGNLDIDLQVYAKQVHNLAHWMAENLPDDPQLTLGLHDLLRAKDCFVRTALARRERDLNSAARGDPHG